ncbi:MAG: hypothetical protein HY646_16240, partial [Acidobacteria bacterium]|nr:hypothetical protein [Acidobacteriota bacterium]
LDSQIFNLPASSRVSGSITAETDSPDLHGFFLTGDFASLYLDGGEALTRAYKKLYFTDVIQNSVTSTEIHLMNVKDSAISVELALVNSFGATVRINRSIPPRGKIEETVSALFSFRDDIGSGYVTASASDDALVGFELIRQPSTVFGLNAQPEEKAAATLYSAHLAAGEFGVHFNTRLNIVNIGSTQATLTLSILSDSGQVLATPAFPTAVSPGSQVTLDAQTFFSLAAATQGSVKIVGSAGARLIGNVLFGDGDPRMKSLGFGAALPLAGTGSTNFLFSQLAQGQAYYTGLAFLALEDTSVTAQVYKPDGTSLGTATLNLSAGTRQVHLIYELVPTLREQLGGYVKVTSTRPVIGFELLGSTSGLFLSAVAPQSLDPN